jgi:hypothetical protein
MPSTMPAALRRASTTFAKSSRSIRKYAADFARLRALALAIDPASLGEHHSSPQLAAEIDGCLVTRTAARRIQLSIFLLFCTVVAYLQRSDSA